MSVLRSIASGVSARTVGLVAKKELLEALRDKRTLFVALVLPVLLYPLMMLGLAPLLTMQRQKLQQERQPIALTGHGTDVVQRLVLTPEDTEDTEDGGDDEEAQEEDAEPTDAGLDVVEVSDPAAALAAGDISLWIEVSEDFGTAVFHEETGHLQVHRDSSEDSSNAAYGKWVDALQAAEERLLDKRMIARDLGPGFRNPIEPAVVDVASAEHRSAYVLGKMLALILVIMTLSSSFYPAVDVVAGEKERGTMETLLVAPCGRAELVLGKFVAVMVVTLAAAILNLVSMGLTMGPLVGGLGVKGLSGISFSPMAAAGVLALLVPLSALFSALSLALSTMARSVKEAQHYLTPMFLLVMPLAMVVIIPNIPFTPTLAAVPITNVVLFFRDLMLGKADMLTTSLTLITTVVAAGLALYVTVALFLREETLFRGPEGTGSLIARPQPRPTPRAPSAVFLFAASMAIIWYAQPVLPQDDLILSVLVTQFGVILAPCLLLAWWLRVDLLETFRFRMPRWGLLAAAVPIGLTAPVVNAAIQRQLFGETIPPGHFREFAERFTEMVGATHPAVLVLVFGALPGLFEEIVFRGFILSSLRASMRGKNGVLLAVALTAVFFGLFHIYPEKWLSTGMTGLVLGLLCVAGRSLWPAVIAHALNNGSLMLIEKYSDEIPAVYVPYDTTADGHAAALTVSAVVLAAGLAYAAIQARSAVVEDAEEVAADPASGAL